MLRHQPYGRSDVVMWLMVNNTAQLMIGIGSPGRVVETLEVELPYQNVCEV